MASMDMCLKICSQPFADALRELGACVARVGVDRAGVIWRDVFGDDIDGMRRKNKMGSLAAFRFEGLEMTVMPSFKLMKVLDMMKKAAPAATTREM